MQALPDFFKQFQNKRQLFILILGFSSGLPLLLTMSTLQAWFTVSGVNLVTIGALSFVGTPYLFKFLWAPLLDRYHLPFLGRRTGWVLVAQVALIIGLLLMAWQDPAFSPDRLALFAVFVAFASATQDIAIDAYRTDLVTPEERGVAASMNTFGYRIAMILAGAALLILVDYLTPMFNNTQWAWRLSYISMAGVMALCMIATVLAPSPVDKQVEPQSLAKAVYEPIQEFFSRPGSWTIIAFIILYKYGDAVATSLMTPFLLRGLGFSLTQMGVVYKTVAFAATVIGVMCGGASMNRLGMYRALWYFGLLQAISNLALAVLAFAGKSLVVMSIAVFIENFCGGLGTTVFVAFLMSLCDSRYTATQFALLSACMSVGRVTIGPLAALLVEQIGWMWFFIVSIAFAYPGMQLLYNLRKNQAVHGETILQ